MQEPDAKRAWETVLEQLSYEMPAPMFDEWVRDTRVLSYSDGHLVVGAKSDYACEWLENRIASTAARLLIGILKRQVEIEFVVLPNTHEQAEENSPQGGNTGFQEISLEASTRYEAEVKPHRVVVIPGYALRLLAHGDLTAKEMSLWVGFRQAAFFDWKKAGRGRFFTKKIPYQEIIRFAGMGRASYFRATTGKDSLAGGMIQRVPDIEHTPTFDPRIDNATRWKVAMYPRLTRRDATVIEAILSADVALASTARERIEAARRSLRKMLSQSVSDYLDTPRLVEVPKYAPGGVVEIVRRALGMEEDIPESLFELAEALQNRIIQAYGNVVITHYFLEEAAPYFKLTQAQIWAIIVFRDRCYYDYESGEEHDFVMASNGLETIASWTGASVKSLKRWLEQPEFRQFVQVESVDIPNDNHSEGASRLRAFLASGGMILRVRKEEPPLAYAATAEGTLVPIWSTASLASDKVSNDSGQSEQWVWTNRVMTLDKVSNESGQSEHCLNNLIKPLLNLYKPHKPPTSATPVATVSPSKPKGGGWEMEKLLRLNPVSEPRLRKRLLERGDPRAFVSWILYGFGPDGKGVRSPSSLAIANIGRNPQQSAGGVYERLSKLPPSTLHAMFEKAMNGSLVENGDFRKAFKHLSEGTLRDVAGRLFDSVQGESTRS